MIYLLEDRRDRFENQLKAKLDQTVINTDTTINCKLEDLVDSFDDYFPDAELILLHNSFKFPDPEIKPETFEKICAKFGIALVIFSGAGTPFFSGPNGTINSQDLYSILPWFVKQRDPKNISKLILGKKYILNILKIYQDKVYDILFDLPSKYTLDPKTANKLTINLNRFTDSALAEDKSELQKVLSQDPLPTVQEYKKFVQQIIDRYK